MSFLGQLSPAGIVTRGVMMAGSDQRRPDQVHSWAQPSAVPQTPRADSCLMPVCPWCILRATHGDEQSATRQAAQASACIHAGPAEGHAHYIVAHALKWCKELCRRDAQPPGPPASQSVQTGSAWLQAGWTQTQEAGRTSVAQWMQVSHPSSTGSSSSWQPRVPALPPPPGLASGSAAATPLPQVAGQVPPAPPPLPEPPKLTFQVWGGKKTQWVSYEEPVQQQLRQLWANGGGAIEVLISGHVYEICLRDVDDMEQDRVDTDQPARRVRIMELSDY